MSDVLFSSLWALLCAGIFVWFVAQGSCAALTHDPNSVPKFSSLPALAGPAGMGSAGMRDSAARDANRAGALRARTASRMNTGGEAAGLGAAGLSGLGPNVLSGDGYGPGASGMGLGLPAAGYGVPGMAPGPAGLAPSAAGLGPAGLGPAGLGPAMLPQQPAFGAPAGPMPSRNSKLPTGGGDGGLGLALAPMPMAPGLPGTAAYGAPQPAYQQPYQQPFYGQPPPGQFAPRPQQPPPQFALPGQPLIAPSGQQLFFGGQGAYPQAPYGYAPQIMAPETAAAPSRPVLGPFAGTSFAGGQLGRRRLLAARMEGGERGVCGAYNMVLACAAANLLLFVATALLAGADMARGKGWLAADGSEWSFPAERFPALGKWGAPPPLRLGLGRARCVPSRRSFQMRPRLS